MGGKLEIHIKLRTPLLKKDIAKKQEKWVVLDLAGDGGDSSAAAAAAAAPSRPVSTSPQAGAPKVATGGKPASATSSPATPSPQTKQPSPQAAKPSLAPQATGTKTGAPPSHVQAKAASPAGASASGGSEVDELEERFLR